MRIAIVQEHLDPQRGGAETSVLEMTRRLQDMGVDVSLICASAGDEIRPTAHVIRTSGLSRAARTRSFIDAADSFCRSEGFDIIHAVTPCRSCNVYQPRGGTYDETIRRSIALAGGGILRRWKALGRTLNRRQQYLARLEREILSRTEPPYVAAVSAYVKRQVCENSRLFPRERVRVIFNGVDAVPLPPDQARRERAAIRARLGVGSAPLALFVAHNFRLKGLGELISASATLEGRSAGYHLAIAGRDRQSGYAAQAARVMIEKRVHFVGSQTPVRSLLAAADVLVHPTWYDPCSRVVLEALACGVPVVTTRYNGAAEVISEFDCGSVIHDATCARALVAGVMRCTETGFRERCRNSAAAWRQRVSMERHARELLSLYQQVVASGLAGSKR